VILGRSLALVVLGVGVVVQAAAQEIIVAAASDLQFAMQDITARFEKQTGKRVKVVYGSSGNFFQQIQNGAPFDLFFSANLDYAKKLEPAGFAEPGTLYKYATGKIVIWAPADSKVNLKNGLRALLDPAVRKIAVANPEHAPYGQAAVAAMKKENVYDRLEAKLVLGENISQTASFALSGSADVGIVALSLAVSPNMKGKGRYVEVPTEDYPPIEQGCVLLRASQKKEAARAFLEFFKTPAVTELLRAYGFGVE
jgi:molybdate transport system substrate-binding protein